MNAFKRHIAFILIGLFLFPIVFHSVHTLQHKQHSVKHNIQHHKSHHNAVELTSEEDSDCPICEYQFAVNHIERLGVFEVFTPQLLCPFIELIIQKLYIISQLKLPLRAPPIGISF